MPEDDGAPTTSPGRVPPALRLPSTAGGEVDLAERGAPGPLVAYVYPRTGTPGEPLADGLGRHPGRARLHAAELRLPRPPRRVRAARRLGGRDQRPDPAEQAEFAAREHIPFPLLSDPAWRSPAALRLPTFEAGGMTLYRRLTLVAEAGRIVKAFYPVFPPDRNAAEVLGWLRDR